VREVAEQEDEDPLRLANLGPKTRLAVMEGCREIRAAAHQGFHILSGSAHAEAINAAQRSFAAAADKDTSLLACLGLARTQAESTDPNEPTVTGRRGATTQHPRGQQEACAESAQGARDGASWLRERAHGVVRWVVAAQRCLVRQVDWARATAGRGLPKADSGVLFGMADDVPGADWLILQAMRLFHPEGTLSRAPQTDFRASQQTRLLAERIDACLTCS
jgi:hypothetical protein